MKDNLQTFPVKSTPQAYERWKKAFEKELRELKEYLDERQLPTLIDIKEILGQDKIDSLAIIEEIERREDLGEDE